MPSATHSYLTTTTVIRFYLMDGRANGQQESRDSWINQPWHPPSIQTSIGWHDSFPYGFRWSFSRTFWEVINQCAQKDFNILTSVCLYLCVSAGYESWGKPGSRGCRPLARVWVGRHWLGGSTFGFPFVRSSYYLAPCSCSGSGLLSGCLGVGVLCKLALQHGSFRGA